MHVVKKYFQIFLQTIRIRTTVLMWTFCLIGLVQANATLLYTPKLLLAFAAIACWYAFSTVMNDISDQAIDKINLIHQSKERPLVNGSASTLELRAVGVISACIALALSLIISAPAFIATALALVYGAVYSLKPIRISYRGILAPLTLPLAYVVYTYLLGHFLVDTYLNQTDALLLFILYAAFFGRIVLKDLRDVVGDKKFKKRTFTVRYGVKVTAIASAIGWIVACVASFLYFDGLVVWMGIGVLIGFVLYALWQLSSERLLHNQLVLVAVIGRLGNGVAIVILTSLFTGRIQFINFLIVGIVALHLSMARDTWRSMINASDEKLPAT